MIRPVVIVILAAVTSLTLNTGLSPAADRAAKPGVLFLLADDGRWGDFSCHGHPYVRLDQKGFP